MAKLTINNSISSDRLPALDLARIFAMLMMIQGHTIFELTKPELINVNLFPWNAWEFMRGLTAPIFLIVSGAVNVFANKRDETGKLPRKTAFRRLRMALMLIFLGYFLVFPADKLFHIAFIHPDDIVHFYQISVLQIIGVSLLLLLLLFLLTRSDKQLGITALILTAVIAALNPFIHKINFFNILPEFFAAYLSMEHGSIFTIFPFTGFVLFGVAFGTILKNVPPEKRNDWLVKYPLLISIPFFALGIPLYYYIFGLNYPYFDLMKANTGIMLIRIGCVMVIISLITMIYKASSGLAKYYSIFGKRALFVYISHLVLLYGLPWFSSFGQVYHQKLGLEWSAPTAIAVQIFSLLVAYLYDRSLSRNQTMKYFYRYAFSMLIVFLLFV